MLNLPFPPVCMQSRPSAFPSGEDGRPLSADEIALAHTQKPGAALRRAGHVFFYFSVAEAAFLMAA